MVVQIASRANADQCQNEQVDNELLEETDPTFLWRIKHDESSYAQIRATHDPQPVMPRT